MPIILRKDEDGGDHYTFIGECYLHTMMDGKAVDVQEEAVRKAEESKRNSQSDPQASEERWDHGIDMRYRMFELR